MLCYGKAIPISAYGGIEESEQYASNFGYKLYSTPIIMQCKPQPIRRVIGHELSLTTRHPEPHFPLYVHDLSLISNCKLYLAFVDEKGYLNVIALAFLTTHGFHFKESRIYG